MVSAPPQNCTRRDALKDHTGGGRLPGPLMNESGWPISGSMILHSLLYQVHASFSERVSTELLIRSGNAKSSGICALTVRSRKKSALRVVKLSRVEPDVHSARYSAGVSGLRVRLCRRGS